MFECCCVNRYCYVSWIKVFCYQNGMVLCSKITVKKKKMEIVFSIFSPINCSQAFGFYYNLLIIESGVRTYTFANI